MYFLRVSEKSACVRVYVLYLIKSEKRERECGKKKCVSVCVREREREQKRRSIDLESEDFEVFPM